MKKQYDRTIFYSREDKRWIGVAPELKGCSAFGPTPLKALSELDTAMDLWLGSRKDRRWPVPEPLVDKKTNGKVLLRLPKSLHKEYMYKAAAEGVSVNQYMLFVLARYIALGEKARVMY